jgi:aarF domain-containing kinase
LARRGLSHQNSVGQHLASLDYLLPEEYLETLEALFDDNHRTSFDDVQTLIKEEFGRDVEDLFDGFEREPIASASLAQVHVAYEKDSGRKLAVKVQHRGLRETSRGDLRAVVGAVRALEFLMGKEQFKWGWLADEIAPQLPLELDFVREGRNAERAARDLASQGLGPDLVVVPSIVWDRTTSRVLTMEFEEGFKATDGASIESHGLRKKDVARLISCVFSSQVFLSGFVHCDPHPANVLIRPRQGAGSHKPQLVLVDHGLYRELDPDFRAAYARLWRSIALADLDGIRDACRGLGLEDKGGQHALFSAVLTARPFDEMVERSKNRTTILYLLRFLRARSRTVAEEEEGARADRAVIRGYARRYLRNIFDLLGSAPRQVLLLLKMNDCLRHIGRSLGSPPSHSLAICGRYAAASALREELRRCDSGSSWLARLRAWWDYARALARIEAHAAAVGWLEGLRS